MLNGQKHIYLHWRCEELRMASLDLIYLVYHVCWNAGTSLICDTLPRYSTALFFARF
jgi:hypothetical protein